MWYKKRKEKKFGKLKKQHGTKREWRTPQFLKFGSLLQEAYNITYI